MLSDLQKSDKADKFLFKGGTSLSKAWGIINRFSEDVDLCVRPDTDMSLTKTKLFKDDISKEIEKSFMKVDNHPEEIKGGTRRKTIHPYKSFFDYGNANIIVEVSALRPNSIILYSSRNIESYLQNFLEKIGRKDLIEELGMQATQVLCVNPVKTLCDKLCRVAKSAGDDSVMRQKIRDIYDIHYLLNSSVVKEYFVTEDFVQLFQATKNEENENGNTVPNFSDVELYKNPKTVFIKYRNDFKEMEKLVFTGMPSIAEMAHTFSSNYERLKTLDK
ncbi:MAG: nucleotidyl transferase AbiEii/AbiGii toxin family protein [Bacteroidales bacterium]|jgi:hypothetical protein|nr:nucleotidyl transferase AbiEii/AbiGii toxin family protein [Bacteroidales bacterium]